VAQGPSRRTSDELLKSLRKKESYAPVGAILVGLEMRDARVVAARNDGRLHGRRSAHG